MPAKKPRREPESEFDRGFNAGYKQAVHDAMDAVNGVEQDVENLLVEPTFTSYSEGDRHAAEGTGSQ